MVERTSATTSEEGTTQHTFGSEQAEKQKRRQRYAEERGSPTKRQRNRDWENVPSGSLATD